MPASVGLVTDMGHITLEVGDMEEALRLYRDALGLAVVGKVNPVWTVVATEGGALTLYQKKAPIPCARRDGESPINLHVANFEEAGAVLERAGYRVRRAGAGSGVVQDSWGNVVGLHDHREG